MTAGNVTELHPEQRSITVSRQHWGRWFWVVDVDPAPPAALCPDTFPVGFTRKRAAAGFAVDLMLEHGWRIDCGNGEYLSRNRPPPNYPAGPRPAA